LKQPPNPIVEFRIPKSKFQNNYVTFCILSSHINKQNLLYSIEKMIHSKFMKKTIFYFFWASLFTNSAFSQDVSSPLGNDKTQHIIDRLDIKTGIPATFHTVQKPYTRKAVTQHALHLDTAAQAQLSALDRADLQYIYNDNVEYIAAPEFATTLTGPREPQAPSIWNLKGQPFYKYLYKTPANFYEFDSKYFKLKINPLLTSKFGKSRGEAELPFTNQRGIEARGSIDDRIFFYTNLLENQSRFPNYATEHIRKYNYLPGAGLYKDYPSGFLGGKNAFDYLMAEGYIGFNVTKHVGVQFGHGKIFIGDGYRSLFLSDNADNYLYLKLNTNIWKFNYQNIFAEIGIDNNVFNAASGLYGKKYFAAHHLSYRLLKDIQIGLFESVVFSRPNHFELQYLNPVIFYRSAEHHIGSPDNAMVGIDGKWNLFKRFSLYGQFMLDELHFKSLVSQNNSWANKYSIQAGLKYIDMFGINHLDGQAEYNLVRPFTYTHYDSVSNYTHRSQPLAHPLGANFAEMIFKLRYQPIHKLILEGRMIRAKVGEELNNGKSYGNDIRLLYVSRVSETAPLFQGNLATITSLIFDASYQLHHNVFLDFNALLRQKNSSDATRNQRTLYFGGGIRINMRQRRMDF
jgi:Capsule assembly protein Wzi